MMMIWWYTSPAACWSFQKLLRGHFGTFFSIPLNSDGNPRSASVAVNYIQILNFTGASTPHQYCNTIPSSISVSFPSVLSLLPSFHTGTIARTMPGCHHIKTPTKREQERARARARVKRKRATERGTVERKDTENYSVGRNLIVHQRKTEGKKLPLKLIIYPWEEKPQRLSLSLSVDVLFCLCLSHGANCLHATSVYFYTLLSNPAFYMLFHLSLFVRRHALFTLLWHPRRWQHSFYRGQLSDFSFRRLEV